MDLTHFIQGRRGDWKRLEEFLEQVEGSGLRTLTEEAAVEFGQLYRRAASDLNQAQTFVSGESTVQYLNELVARCYMAIYARSRIDVWGVFKFYLWNYPAVFRRNVRYFLLACVICLAGTIFGFLASYFDPQVGRAFLLPQDFPMIQPEKEGEADLQPAHTTGELSGFSAFLFRHNLSVTLVAFALGITWGIGTLLLMWSTGVMMGTLGAVFMEAGQFTAFCTGILPHGVLEIPSALLGGAAGFMLAETMFRARPWPRLEELARTAKEALKLVGGTVPLLAAAGFLEAVVARAPDRYLDAGFKLAVAAAVLLLFAIYLLALGRRSNRQNQTATRALSSPDLAPALD
jgi:uncharacterized membrane protein SpoIIM required for sporulation